ncbi:hypothetical protein VCRA2116O29_270069 [Vibrio crassostreae]|nr:hypothetical protein VCRA2116O29_270069 [Vibrio crassostreae]CAK2485188.1 hypothetical protein VCRA2119O48_390012 [Vibrio crassostreae]CAK2987510.1 hypothetical protein VCRA2133E348_480010 [Vibrio crassostreae]CAK3151017.1 hypothetical protein VCRA213O314_120105 [Vibrio crassostreae]CAK3732856.1 hypothetical protein VCRA2123O74_250069 [Vibrio crassostreae]
MLFLSELTTPTVQAFGVVAFVIPELSLGDISLLHMFILPTL